MLSMGYAATLESRWYLKTLHPTIAHEDHFKNSATEARTFTFQAMILLLSLSRSMLILPVASTSLLLRLVCFSAAEINRGAKLVRDVKASHLIKYHANNNR